MLRFASAIILFIVQIPLVLLGGDRFGKIFNPYLIFTVSTALWLIYMWSVTRYEQVAGISTEYTTAVLGMMVGFLSIAIACKAAQSLFLEFPDPGKLSDVITQLETQYRRFLSGVFPYSPLEEYPWHPYPVYMPLHWLPLGIPIFFHVDVRWAGILLMAIATAIWGIYVSGRPARQSKGVSILLKVIVIFLPSLALWGFFFWGRYPFGVTLESSIAAYYLVLACGLAARSLPVTMAGIILCLLSRYTIVFWLPLFAVLLWLNAPARKNIMAWGIVLLSVLLVYVVPFYLQDPSILTEGLKYHNNVAIYEWTGYGEPKVSWTFESGIYFGRHLRDLLSGDMVHRVFIGRVIQAALMLLLLVGGWLIYKRRRINFYDLSLGMLYLTILFFYLFGVLTYNYYYLPLFMISAVLCGKITEFQKKKTSL